MRRPDHCVYELPDRQSQTEEIVRCSACCSKSPGIFCNLDHSRSREFDQIRQKRVYPEGALIFMEGDEPRAAYSIGSGQVKLFSSSPDGRAVIDSIAVTGDLLGVIPLLLERPYDLTAIVIEQAQLCVIPKQDFLAFLERNGDVSLGLARKLSAELNAAHRKFTAVLKPVTQRVAELLLVLCQTHGEPTPTGINLRTNLRQEEMAELLGLSPRSLSRAFAELRSQGFIKCRRRSILVPNSVVLRDSLSS